VIPSPRRTAVQRQPKYLRIYTDLRDRIATGRWPAGSSLPAQRDLADEFGVSIMTLRQALQLLADEGLVGTRHGLGTYVTERFAHDLGHLNSFTADLARQGAPVTTRVLDAAAVTPPEEVGARLGHPAEALRLRRLRLIGGRPVVLQVSWLPVPLPGGLGPWEITGGLSERGLYPALADRGLTVARASETITPTALSAGDAADLGRPAGSLALLSHRVSFTAAGDPVIDDHALLPADAVAIRASRSPEHLDVSYELTAPGSPDSS
jgi:GntR family transcriptional regulator